MTFLSGQGGVYNPKRDGPLEKYLETHDGIQAFPLFKRYKHYKMLWDEGYLSPSISIIRVMWNMCRDDEHFLVIDENTIEGIEAPRHGGRSGRHDGRSGRHDARKLLDARGCPAFEAQHLNPRPVPRVENKP